jgi:branched-chain amino acid transport system substrate-binding protein
VRGAPILVGLDQDSTGPGAAFSTIAGKTIRIAVQDINDHGGVLGRPLQLVVDNDGSDPAKAPAVVRRLADHGAKVVLLQTGAAAIAAAQPTVADLRRPAIAPTGVTANLAAPWLYLLGNPTSDWAKVYCGAFGAAHITRVGLLTDDTTTIADLDRALVGAMGCVQFVATERGAGGAADLSPQVAQLRTTGVDAVLVTSIGGAFEALAQSTLADQLPDKPRFTLAPFGNQPGTWKLATAGKLDGLIVLSALNPTNPRTQELAAILKVHNGNGYEPTAYDAQAWDAVQLVKLAIEQAGAADDPGALNDALDRLSGYRASFGQPGLTLSYSPTKHVGADGLCGLSLVEFGSDNRPRAPWATYQPPCTS